MTRTFFVGQPKPEWQKVYNIVKKAYQKTRKYISTRSLHRNKVKAKQVDKVCRDFMKNQDYGKYFIHNTGHGVGLQPHEKPTLSPKSKQVLKPGMVITIEPGVYLSDKFGVRIEDTVILS